MEQLLEELPPRKPVIIDTDPGVDDTVAILLALASPELEILAIIVSYGNTDIQSSYLNILKIYKAISNHLERFPEDTARFPNFSSTFRPYLAKGPDGPLEGELRSAEYFHGRDGLGGIDERHADLDVDASGYEKDHPQLLLTSQSGTELALELIKSHPSRTITYIALGPLTNLALMLRSDPLTVRDRLGRVVCMGGALDVPGNTSPSAEFNFFADPYAVKELILPSEPNTGLPLERFVMLPLDITTPHQLHFPLYQKVVDPTFDSSAKPSSSSEKSPVTHFTSSFFERTREIMLMYGADHMELHDPVAVWCAIETPVLSTIEAGSIPPLASGWKAVKRVFQIERTGELTRGMLVVDRRLDESAYAPGANRAEVQATLNRLGIKLKYAKTESTALPAQVQVESPSSVYTPAEGVCCVTETPGPETFLKILLARVWGVTEDAGSFDSS